ncbi:MAG TPA: AIR synthase-related protein, partial [Verrucomicrobiae bacterium]|nr:AIR synthase-related protein [Verrucomicrobiae bacterium]
ELIRERGGVPEEELYQVFNMGIGMILIVAPEKAPAVLRVAQQKGHGAWMIGEVVRGKGRARVV